MSDTVNSIYSSSNNIAKFSKKYFDYLNNILNQIDNQKIQLFVKHLEKLRKPWTTVENRIRGEWCLEIVTFGESARPHMSFETKRKWAHL